MPNLYYLRVLGLTIYIFILEKKRNTKSANRGTQSKCRMLVNYDGGTIYWLYLYDKAKFICIKNLKILENIDKKEDCQIFTYNAIITPENYLVNNKLQHTTSTPSSLLSLF